MELLGGSSTSTALVMALVAWSLFAGGVGLVGGWLTLRRVLNSEDPRRGRPRRWGGRGLTLGGLFAATFWLATRSAPQYTGIVLWLVLCMAAGAVALSVWGGPTNPPTDQHELIAGGLLVGGLVSVLLQALARDPAALLTLMGFASWGPPLAAIARVSVPGRSRPASGSAAGTTLFATLTLTAAGLALVLAGWRAPWLVATPVLAGVGWAVLGWILAGFARLSGMGRSGAGRPMPVTLVGEKNTGPVVLVEHGYMVTGADWSSVAELLAKRGYVLALLEMPWGPDGTRPPLKDPVLPWTRRGQDEVLGRLDRLYPDRPKFLLGQSFGGGFVLSQAGSPHPSVAGILAIAPVGLEMAGNLLLLGTPVMQALRWIPGLPRMLTLVIRRVAVPPAFQWFLEAVQEFGRASRAFQVGPRTLGELLRALPPTRIECPVSVLFGRDDPAVAARSARRLSLLPGLDLAEVEGGHDLHLSQPRRLVEWADTSMRRMRGDEPRRHWRRRLLAALRLRRSPAPWLR